MKKLKLDEKYMEIYENTPYKTGIMLNENYGKKLGKSFDFVVFSSKEKQFQIYKFEKKSLPTSIAFGNSVQDKATNVTITKIGSNKNNPSIWMYNVLCQKFVKQKTKATIEKNTNGVFKIKSPMEINAYGESMVDYINLPDNDDKDIDVKRNVLIDKHEKNKNSDTKRGVTARIYKNFLNVPIDSRNNQGHMISRLYMQKKPNIENWELKECKNDEIFNMETLRCTKNKNEMAYFPNETIKQNETEKYAQNIVDIIKNSKTNLHSSDFEILNIFTDNEKNNTIKTICEKLGEKGEFAIKHTKEKKTAYHIGLLNCNKTNSIKLCNLSYKTLTLRLENVHSLTIKTPIEIYKNHKCVEFKTSDLENMYIENISIPYKSLEQTSKWKIEIEKDKTSLKRVIMALPNQKYTPTLNPREFYVLKNQRLEKTRWKSDAIVYNNEIYEFNKDYEFLKKPIFDNIETHNGKSLPFVRVCYSQDRRYFGAVLGSILLDITFLTPYKNDLIPRVPVDDFRFTPSILSHKKEGQNYGYISINDLYNLSNENTTTFELK